MFPLLPILILLLLGPANAERLAFEGRLPAAVAAHLVPVRATVVAPCETEAPRTATLRSGPLKSDGIDEAMPLRRAAVQETLLPAAPPRAGPQVA